MKWLDRDGGALSSPYSIYRETRGFSVWYKRGDKFGVLARELPTLGNAKDFADKHRVKEVALLKSLDAVDIKS